MFTSFRVLRSGYWPPYTNKQCRWCYCHLCRHYKMFSNNYDHKTVFRSVCKKSTLQQLTTNDILVHINFKASPWVVDVFRCLLSFALLQWKTRKIGGLQEYFLAEGGSILMRQKLGPDFVTKVWPMSLTLSLYLTVLHARMKKHFIPFKRNHCRLRKN